MSSPIEFRFTVPGAMLVLAWHQGTMSPADVSRYQTSICGALERCEARGFVTTDSQGTRLTPLGKAYVESRWKAVNL